MYGNVHKRLLGVVFIGLLVLGVWFVNGVFNQKFTKFDKVTLETDTAGLNLPTKADVKVRGLIVGEVLKASSTGSGARLTLGIQPDKIREIPANVTASLVPKTLFGEKYVSLDIPKSGPAQQSLKTGAVIGKTKLPIELERVLNDLFPLLRSVQPAEVKYTLDALATALEGRGQDLGESLDTLGRYLTRLNPQVPQMMQDLRLLATVSNTYADVMPQLAHTLRNTIKTGGTLVEKEGQLKQFLDETTRFSDTTKDFLDQNGRNIVRLSQLTTPQLRLLQEYSPEFPCLFAGIVKITPRLADTFRGSVFHINLKTLRKQPRGYRREDLPLIGVTGKPNCVGLPNPPVPLKFVPNFNDGVDNIGKGDNQRTAPGFDNAPMMAAPGGSEQSKVIVRSLTAPVLGVPADQVPDVATLLFGPLVAGTEVTMQ